MKFIFINKLIGILIILSLSVLNSQIKSQETDYNTTNIANGVFLSSAVQTNQSNWPNPGRIWVASAQYKNAMGDTIRIYYSDNGGASFNLAYSLTRAGWNFDFRPGELDIELCYDGTAVWLFGVAGFNQIGGSSYSYFFRINTATNAIYSADLVWPGSVIGNLFYNPRITSDNSVNTSTTQIFITCSFDSTFNTNQHYLASKFCKATSIFSASPSFNYGMPSGNRFFNQNAPIPANTYLWTDIAYTKSGASDRVLVVYKVSYIGSILLSWSDNYGVSITGSQPFSISAPVTSVKMAFNGGAGISSGIITYIRDVTATNSDAEYLTTTNGGINWGSFFLDISPFKARSIDVIAIRGANNQFKIAYTQDSASNTYGYYTGGTPVTFTQPVRTLVSSSGIDTVNTKIIAGYVQGVDDDCFAVYSNSGGNNIIASRNCTGTVGISGNNNTIPNEYRLEQNYPNPFNPTTNIKFSIPKSSFVKLVVYDASGKEVETLVNSNLTAGSYSYDFNAERLASGVYFYKLEAEGFSSVKKMVLVK